MKQFTIIKQNTLCHSAIPHYYHISWWSQVDYIGSTVPGISIIILILTRSVGNTVAAAVAGPERLRSKLARMLKALYSIFDR